MGKAKKGHRNVRRLSEQKRRAEVVRLYLDGKRQIEIAAQLGVSQPTVSKDLAAAKAEWRAERLEGAEELVDLHARRYEDLYAGAKDVWERSRRGRKPNLRAHQQALRSLAHLANLFGLNKPVKIAQTDAEGNALPIDERRSRLHSVLALLRDRGGVGPTGNGAPASGDGHSGGDGDGSEPRPLANGPPLGLPGPNGNGRH